MAKRVVTLVIKSDDLTGEDIPDGHGESFVYAWEGSEWEIDLNDKNAADIREMMGRLTEVSRKIGKYKPSISVPSRKAIPATAPKELPSGEMSATQQKYARSVFMKEIRTWARANGYPQQSPVGRLLAEVREAWNEAHPDRPAPTEDSFVK